ncbi:hypothetical protein BCR33DRAFT_779608 [Rhizoclosmatium globosum]|uniref:Uncharacterized protein n=1 Tax=Rhizoclosmatium globosum TaxID=329046 RepID=A0A1Y2D0Z7_9FUNG|nr:hypothetical protein BCR33DRAFT_779608 [Rhizoclosmatium globosum]|eukprot:ORY52275.1 hypothetical protein BCR33DRAFT_779608 [Rhizoclosmatium globosum]
MTQTVSLLWICQNQKSHRPKALPVAPSSSSSAAYAYSESASSSYIYDPNAATDAQSYGSYYDQEDDSTRYAQVHLDDSALHRLGHRSGLGAVQVVDLNHEDQLGGEEARMRNIKNLSREKVEKSAYEHSIMALAYEAKAREHELKEAFADRRQAKASSMNKYGF